MFKVSAQVFEENLSLTLPPEREPHWEALLPKSFDSSIASKIAAHRELSELSKLIYRTDPRVRTIRVLRAPLEESLVQLDRSSPSFTERHTFLSDTVRSSQDAERLAVHSESRGRLAALQGNTHIAATLYHEAALQFATAVRCLLPSHTELPVRSVVLKQLEYEQQHIPRAAQLVDDRKATVASLASRDNEDDASDFRKSQHAHAQKLLATALKTYHHLRENLDRSKELLRRACLLDEGACIAHFARNDILESTLREEAESSVHEATDVLHEREGRSPRVSRRVLRGSQIRASLLLERLSFHALGELDERRAVVTACHELISRGDIKTPLSVLTASGFIMRRDSSCDPHRALSGGLEQLVAPLGQEALSLLTQIRIDLERTRSVPLWSQLQGLQIGMPTERRSRALQLLRNLLPDELPSDIDAVEDSLYLVSSPAVPFLAFGIRAPLGAPLAAPPGDLTISGFATTLRNGVRATFTDLGASNYESSSLHEASHVLTTIEWGKAADSIELKVIDELAARLTDPTAHALSCAAHAEFLIDFYLPSFISEQGSSIGSSRGSSQQLQHRQELEEWRTEPYRSRHISELFRLALLIDECSTGDTIVPRLTARRILLDCKSLKIAAEVLQHQFAIEEVGS